jgi:hypothetical protein
LCKSLPLLALDKIIRLGENNVDLGTYDGEETLVWKMLEIYNVLVCLEELDKAKSSVRTVI